LDSVGGSVFAVSSNNGAGAVVVQASTSLSVKSTVNIGIGSSGGTSVNIYDGDFVNNFTTPLSGHLLVRGTSPTNSTPYRYLLPFDGSGNLTAVPGVAVSTSTAARCGPVTEFFNPNIGGGTDFLFWSVSQNCSPGANGCVMSLVNGVPGPNFAKGERRGQRHYRRQQQLVGTSIQHLLLDRRGASERSQVNATKPQLSSLSRNESW
jgi:hypothetical protein